MLGILRFGATGRSDKGVVALRVSILWAVKKEGGTYKKKTEVVDY